LGLIIPSVYSSGPVFNYKPDDLPTLSVANYSQETDWQQEVSGKSGDRISYRIFIHNGVPGSVAKDTVVKASLPTNPAKSLTTTTTISAKNAKSISGNSKVTTNNPQLLEYISGSAKIYTTNDQSGSHLSDDLVSPEGVNIGNIQGCTPYRVWITFQVKLVNQPEAELIKSKSAFNITRGVNAETVVAKPGDQIRYSLKVENKGGASDSIVISDDISKVLRYASMVNLGSGSLNGSTISWPKVTVAPNKSVKREFVVKVKNTIPANKFVYLINSYGNRVEVPAKREVTINPSLSLSKKVRNLSKGEKKFVDKNYAQPGDTLEYLITAKNPGDLRLTNHNVLDNLPSKTSYIKGSVRYGYNNNPIDKVGNDSLVTGGGDNFGRFYVGSRLNITFKVKVDNNLTPGKYSLVNRASNDARFETEIDSGRLTDAAKAITDINIKAQPDFSIDKKVKNLTHPTNYADQITAKAGDRVGYKITLKYFQC